MMSNNASRTGRWICVPASLLRAEQRAFRAAVEIFAHLHRQRPGVQQTQHGRHLARGPIAGARYSDLPAERIQLYAGVVGTGGNFVPRLLHGEDEARGKLVGENARKPLSPRSPTPASRLARSCSSTSDVPSSHPAIALSLRWSD